MLISINTNYYGVRLRFRALSAGGEVERYVELSQDEARDLCRQLLWIFPETYVPKDRAKDPAAKVQSLKGA